MKEEIRCIVTGVVRSLVAQGGLKLSISLLEALSNEDNWVCISTKPSIITNSCMWCYEYIPFTEEYPPYFLQIELQTEHTTVMAINVITDEKNKINKYS